MKNYDKIERRVTLVISEHLGIKTEQVTENKNLVNDLGADSLDIVELTMGFEEEFGIEIPDEVMERLYTVKDCVIYIYNSVRNY